MANESLNGRHLIRLDVVFDIIRSHGVTEAYCLDAAIAGNRIDVDVPRPIVVCLQDGRYRFLLVPDADVAFCPTDQNGYTEISRCIGR